MSIFRILSFQFDVSAVDTDVVVAIAGTVAGFLPSAPPTHEHRWMSEQVNDDRAAYCV